MENTYTVDWSKYFDHIYCLHFLGKNERLRRDMTAGLDYSLYNVPNGYSYQSLTTTV